MGKVRYGFICGKFSVVLSGNDLVLPGSNDQPLKKSLVPGVAPNDAAGHYTMEVKSNGSLVANLPVHVMWVAHPSQPEPFLGLKADDPKELCEALAAYKGQKVELEFSPRKNA